jgi:hypothetical protein
VADILPDDGMKGDLDQLLHAMARYEIAIRSHFTSPMEIGCMKPNDTVSAVLVLGE